MVELVTLAAVYGRDRRGAEYAAGNSVRRLWKSRAEGVVAQLGGRALER